MRIVDLNTVVEESCEILQAAATQIVNFTESCNDLMPEEVAKAAENLSRLGRLAATLSEIALSTISEPLE